MRIVAKLICGYGDVDVAPMMRLYVLFQWISFMMFMLLVYLISNDYAVGSSIGGCPENTF